MKVLGEDLTHLLGTISNEGLVIPSLYLLTPEPPQSGKVFTRRGKREALYEELCYVSKGVRLVHDPC